MSGIRKIPAFLVGVLILFAAVQNVNAIVIDFDESPAQTSIFLFQENGFEIVNSLAGGFATTENFAGPTTDLEIAPGNLFGSGENLILTQTGGGAFDLFGFSLGVFTGLNVSSNFTFTGIKSDLSVVTETILFVSNTTLVGPVFSVGGDSFTDLTSLSFGADSSGNFIALDDIQVAPTLISGPPGGALRVPEPGSLALLGAGLVGMALIRRRRRRGDRLIRRSSC